jgi:hypothetical protein
VVWRTRTESNKIIIGAGRLSPDGELLDRPSTLITSSTSGTLGYPDVVFVGGNFLVVYQLDASVFTRRFSREGRPVDSQPTVISNSPMVAPLATNGKTVFLSTAPNRFRMLAPDGTPIGDERVIPNAGFDLPSIVSNGDRYLVVYPKGPQGIAHGLVVLLTGNGDYLAAQQMPIGALPVRGSIATASDGSSFLVIMALNGPVACVHVDADGNPGPARTVTDLPGYNVVATWSGSEYTLVWLRRFFAGVPILNDIVGARVDAVGLPRDITPVTIASLQNAHYGAVFASASNGQDTIIITGDDTGGAGRNWRTTAAIFSSLPQIDAEPANRRHAAIASSAAEQGGGSIASNGTLSLVTWRERSSLDQTVVRAAFVAIDGRVGAAFDVGEAHPQTATATISDGRNFLVVYTTPLSGVVARRVTLEGVLDSTLIAITNGFGNDAIGGGWSGQAYVIVTTQTSAVTISGITADGSVTARQVIDTQGAPPDTPAVSCAATGCSVTWHLSSPFCAFPVCNYIENDVLARTNALGSIVSRVVLTDAPNVTPARSLPASDGKSMFVYSNGKSMFAGRVTDAGVVLDTPALNGGARVMTSETAFALQPVAVVNSGLYFVEPDSATNGRLYWTRIDPEPTPRVTSLVNLHQGVTFPLTLTASGRNTYFLYSAGDDDQTVMAPRLFLRTFASPDPQMSPVRRHAAR